MVGVGDPFYLTNPPTSNFGSTGLGAKSPIFDRYSLVYIAPISGNT